MAISMLFRPKNRTRDNFFELFAKVFRCFRPRGIFFDGPKNFQILADSAAIRLVQKSSKSEPSSRFFSHLKFRKSLPGSVLLNFPRRIQNRNDLEGLAVRIKFISFVYAPFSSDRSNDRKIDRSIEYNVDSPFSNDFSKQCCKTWIGEDTVGENYYQIKSLFKRRFHILVAQQK